MNADSQKSLASLLFQRVESDSDRAALFVKRDGEFQPLSWGEVFERASRLAEGLRRQGILPGDRVLHVSENRPEWVFTDLAIILAEAVHVPVHAQLSGEQIAFQLTDSGAKLAILSTAEQAEKLDRVAGLQTNAKFFSYESCSDVAGHDVRHIDDSFAAVDRQDARRTAEIASQSLSPEDLATILYTSGTTGEPKGVVLSHGNLASNALGTLDAFGNRADERRLNFLPLSHIFARLCDLYVWIAGGTALGLAESRETVVADCALFHPTTMNGVPYFFDKVRRGLIDAGAADTPGALQGLLGGRVGYCCAGGAGLPEELFDFYAERGLPLLQGYGLTETSPVISVSTEENNRRGAAGRPIADVEVRISDDGEILTRGPHVMQGYYKQPDATAETIDDQGWLKTGDLGSLDSDGFLSITGRKKEIIVTAGGKNVAPVLLEQLLTSDPLILQAMVVGDDRKYLSVLVVPDRARLSSEAGLPDDDDLLHHSTSHALFRTRIDERLQTLSRYEQIAKFALLPRPLSAEHGELTPKLSLRRQQISANWSQLIEGMYE